MEYTTKAWGSPSRYIQGSGVIGKIQIHTKKFGKNAFGIIDTFFFSEYNDFFYKLYKNNSGKFSSFEYKNEITKELINEASKKAQLFKPNVIIGMGGGKALDTAKAVAHELKLPVVIIPTTASTDAPTSAMSILYDDEHKHAGWLAFPQNPELVLVDSKIIAKAPVRFLVAGMGDALATVFEGRASVRADKANYIALESGNFSRTRTAMAIAEECYKLLLEYGLLAKIANENQVVTEPLENIIEANTLMSGLGFENLGVAASHAVCNGLSAIPGGDKALHGEKVAFGVICQLLAENAPMEEINRIIKFNAEVGLPITFEDMSLEPTEENYAIIAKDIENTDWMREPFFINSERVIGVVKTAQALGLRYKKSQLK